MSTSLYHADYEAVRESLRAMRIKANLTQTAIAEQLGVGQSYVSKLERGENYVDVLIFARWCVTCGVRPGLALDRCQVPPVYRYACGTIQVFSGASF